MDPDHVGRGAPRGIWIRYSGFPSPVGYALRRGPSALPLPKWTWSEDGLVIKSPPVDLRAHAHVRLAPIIPYGQPSADGAASLHWTATCTNLNGRQEKVLRIPVEQLSVTLPPDADGPELLAT